MLSKATRGLSAVRNFASYPFRFRRVGRTWGDGFTALSLRIATTPLGKKIFSPVECSLGLKNVANTVTLRRTNSDFLVVRDVFENEEYGFVKSFNLPADATILDLGANIGISSLYFAALLPQSKIIAVEPDSDNCQLIRKNCRSIMADGRMHLEQAFAGGSDGLAYIDRRGASWEFKKSDVPVSGQENIRCLSIPTLMAEHHLEHIHLLKCDIEGSELELFANCAAWIDKVDHIVLELHPPYSLELLHADLKKSGWDYIQHDFVRRGDVFALAALSKRR